MGLIGMSAVAIALISKSVTRMQLIILLSVQIGGVRTLADLLLWARLFVVVAVGVRRQSATA